MRISTLILGLLLTTVSANTMAVETGMNPQAMVYISIPLDGTVSSGNKTTYGFRLDSHAYSRFDNVTYTRQLERPAVFDFKMASGGIEGIYISGIDYYRITVVNRQNGDEGEYEDQVSVMDEVRGIMSDMTAIAPMGVWIGVGLGIGLLLGSDNPNTDTSSN
jgi:hypothetical protein